MYSVAELIGAFHSGMMREELTGRLGQMMAVT